MVYTGLVKILLLLPLIVVGCNSQQTPPTSPKPVATGTYENTVLPISKKFCWKCHSGEKPAKGIDLSKYKTQADVEKNTRAWRRAGREVSGNQMPPKSEPQMSDAEKKAFTDYCKALPRSE